MLSLMILVFHLSWLSYLTQLSFLALACHWLSVTAFFVGVECSPAV
jgi:hypothetical protein